MQIDIHDLRDYFQKNFDKATKTHRHSYYQIIWFKNYPGKHFVDFEEYTVNQECVILTFKNQVHTFDPEFDCEGVLIHFNEDFVPSRSTLSAFQNAYQNSSSQILVNETLKMPLIPHVH